MKDRGRGGASVTDRPASDSGGRRVRDCVTQLPWGFQSDNRTLALEESQCVCGAEQLRQQASADSCSLAWPGMEIPMKSWEQ